MIRLHGINLARGSKTLLAGADLTLNPGERIGLIGANGSGKSSLFALLSGACSADAGALEVPAHWRIAHVAQETPALARTALDYVIDGDTSLRRLEAELAEAEAAHQGERIGALHAALQDADAYTAQARAERLLAGLGFARQAMQQPVARFSGGWRMRLNLAQALMCRSDLLLLDEPTNHLDLDAILWLEDWLRRYPGTLIVISHDRDFLDGVVQVIVHIEHRQLVRYGGHYSDFEHQRAARLALNQAAHARQARERAHLQGFIDRFKAKASKAKQAQSRIKMLTRLQALAPIHAAASFGFEFRAPERAPDPLLVLEQVSAGYAAQPANVVLSGIDLSLPAGSRIGLLGVNGAGKSTLIKTLVGELPPLAGRVTHARGLVIGYFAQHQIDCLRHDESALWHLQRLAPNAREQELRGFLGSFNFPGETATTAIAPFSGGEKARLALALIVWQRPNLLLLDEPTNHLDLDTREALTLALAQFDGSLVLVSHDRHLLRAATESFLIVADGGVQPFEGDLDDYRDWLFKTRLARPGAAEPAAPARAAAPRRDQKRVEAEARQRLAALRKPIEARIRHLERELAGLAARRQTLEHELAAADSYAEARREQLKASLFEQARLAREAEALEDEWLEQQAALERLLAGA